MSLNNPDITVTVLVIMLSLAFIFALLPYGLMWLTGLGYLKSLGWVVAAIIFAGMVRRP